MQSKTWWLHFLTHFSTDQDGIYCLKTSQVEHFDTTLERERGMKSRGITAVSLPVYKNREKKNQYMPASKVAMFLSVYEPI